MELLLEPKTWLFFVFSIVDNIPNSLTNQGTIIIESFGFTTLQVTLLGCVGGVIEIATIWSGVEISSRIPNSRAYVGAIYFLPSLLGVFLVNLLPWSDQVGLLFSAWLGIIQITAFGEHGCDNVVVVSEDPLNSHGSCMGLSNNGRAH